METGSLSSIDDWSLNRACMVNDSSANIAYIYWGSLWRQTCCSLIDGKLQLKHVLAAKKVTQTKKKVTKCRGSRSAKSMETAQYTTPPYISFHI